MNVWPANLPQHAQRSNFSRAMGDTRLRTPNDSGSHKTRNRLSFVPDPMLVAFEMTSEQKARFETFVKDELGKGTLPFRFPAIDEDGIWIVQLGESMPKWTSRAAGLWLVVLDLVKLGKSA